MQDRLTVFVVGHTRRQFAAVGDAPHLERVYLHDISFRQRRLAESRFYLSGTPFRCRSEYIGMASASWNWKYNGHLLWRGRRWPHCLPLEQLDRLDLSPRAVWCAAITDSPRWAIHLDRIFRGIYPLVHSVARHFGLRIVKRNGPLANNYIAHRVAVRSLTHWMRASIAWLDQKYGPVWPIKPDRCGMFADRLPAFMCEALSILWWANQTDLELRQIPPP